MDFNKILRLAVMRKASDIFITAGFPISVKLDGKMVALTKSPINTKLARELVLGVMDKEQCQEFRERQECNFAISEPGVGRFRVSAFKQRGAPGMVLRLIEQNIPDIDGLNLPHVMKDLAMKKRGLIIVAGATGTGKSTSQAAMIGHRNKNDSGHIITIEDPIEFLHEHHQSMITQREVGVDTDSYEVALKNTLRQAPDVIMIGEIRSKESMEYAMTFAETGHLCLATLHANNANQVLDRIIHFFPSEQHDQIWMDLSLNLRGVIAQQLVRTRDGQGRRVALEIMLNTPLVQELIRRGDVAGLKPLMSKSTEFGMQTFDQSLYELFDAGIIGFDEAIAHSDAPNDLRLMIKLKHETDTNQLDKKSTELTLEYSE